MKFKSFQNITSLALLLSLTFEITLAQNGDTRGIQARGVIGKHSTAQPPIYPSSTASTFDELGVNIYARSSPTDVQPPVYAFTDYIPFSVVDNGGTDLAYHYNLASDCNTNCTQTVGCVGFVTNGYDCWLKAAILNVGFGNRVSFFKVKPQRQYSVFNGVNFNQASMITYFGNLTHSRQACDALSGCVGYVTQYKSY